MDEFEQVCIQHLKAALEVWRYCQESAEFIFGRRRSTTIEDEIVELLRGAKKGGVSRTDISAAFSRHRNSYDISVALERLKNLGWAKSQKMKTDGRSTERWFLRERKSQ
jgi:dTDP-D-glucose 4,6-dehydratase